MSTESPEWEGGGGGDVGVAGAVVAGARGKLTQTAESLTHRAEDLAFIW